MVENGVNEYIVPVFVNGVKCAAMRASGCAIVLVHKSVLKDKSKLTGRMVTLQDVFGRHRMLNTSNIKIALPRFEKSDVIEVEAEVDKTLQFEMILGTRFSKTIGKLPTCFKFERQIRICLESRDSNTDAIERTKLRQN